MSQGPRGLPGERGRPGAAGSAVSNCLIIVCNMFYYPLLLFQFFRAVKFLIFLSLILCKLFSLQGARGNDGLPGPAGPPVRSSPQIPAPHFAFSLKMSLIMLMQTN